MKILVPVSNKEYVDSYIKAGADELYLGFHDEKWEEKFGPYSDINRMSGFKKIANPYSLSQLLQIITDLKMEQKHVFVTLNANTYSSNQIKYMEKNYFPYFAETKIDGIIFSDINAMIAAKKLGLHPVASTMCSIYNSDIAEIYYRIGVRRMILPRDVSLEEIKSICKKFPDVEFEAFFMRNGCIFSDGYCLGMHREECGATCTYTSHGRSHYQHNFFSFSDHHDVDVNDYLYRTTFLKTACGMCALYRLNQAGIKSLKIVGRADNHEAICRDIALSKRNIEIMNSSNSEKEYLDKMNFPEGFPQICRMGLCCYYPEIRFESNER